jgi:hypothetical protein
LDSLRGTVVTDRWLEDGEEMPKRRLGLVV